MTTKNTANKEYAMEKNNLKGYYDFDIDMEELLSDKSTLEELFFLKDLKQRKLFLNSDIDQYSIADCVRHIMQFNAEDAGIPPAERKPIKLYVASNGGEVDSGFELISIIQTSKTPIYTVNLGYQYSMGFLIGLAGHKRYAMPHARYLMHDGSSFVYNSSSKLQDQLEFNKKAEERVKKYILSRSRLTEEEYDSKLRVEWFMFADEAKEKGFTDFIIGEDCEIGEVV